jgi:hypothetical protein
VKRLLSLALFAALATSAISCSDSTGPGDSLAGTYTLQSVNGLTPPVIISQDASLTSEVVSGQLVLDAAGNYQGVTRFRDTFTGSQPQLTDETTIGFWTLSGNQIALTDRNFPNDPFVGVVSNNTITLTDNSTGDNFTLVYSK